MVMHAKSLSHIFIELDGTLPHSGSWDQHVGGCFVMLTLMPSHALIFTSNFHFYSESGKSSSFQRC
jgi:hypothetical protein